MVKVISHIRKVNGKRVKVKSHFRKTDNIYSVHKDIKELDLRSNRLPIQFGLIVPSTIKDKKIPQREFKRRISSERKFFTSKFGGDTAIQQSGGYSIKEKGTRKLIVEDGVMVMSSMSAQKYSQKRKVLADHVKKRRKQWKQDTIGYQLEGNFYTYPRKKYIGHDKKNTNIDIIES